MEAQMGYIGRLPLVEYVPVRCWKVCLRRAPPPNRHLHTPLHQYGDSNSPNFFCTTSETVANNSNGYNLDPAPTFVAYLPTAGAYKTANSATASPNRPQYVDVYMNDLLCDAQEDPTQQQRVSKFTILALKDILPSLPGEVKESDRLKKLLDRAREWATIKEILGWAIETHQGSLVLSSKQRIKLISLLEIPDSQRRISI